MQDSTRAFVPLAIGAMLWPPSLMMQAVKSAPESIKQVLVPGHQGSLDQSLDLKQAARGFVDAVSAVDMGKLPDRNIAEARSRIPGVPISKNRGEGDFVSIRGLGLNIVCGTVNDQTLVSTTKSRRATRSGAVESSAGRETNFDVLPSKIIGRLEVVSFSKDWVC